ncbi:MAG: OmpA family protein [Pseudomonadota bacterium]
MDASLHAASINPGLPPQASLPLDTMPLDAMPLDTMPQASLPPTRRGPAPAVVPAMAPGAARSEEPLAEMRPPAQAPAIARPPAANRPAVSRRRPLARFVQEEDSPNFYISLSDLMCLLLVFFVLIFSLGQPAPSLVSAAGLSTAQGPVRVVYRAAMPVAESAPKAPAPDPFALEDASPASTRLGLVAVAMAGTSDPGLPTPLVAELTDEPAPKEKAGVIDRDLLALLSASDSLPAQAAPAEEASLSQLLSQVRQVAPGQEKDGLVVERGSDKVILRLPEAITFDLAKAEVKTGMQQTLARLAQVLARHPRTAVIVTGHTDDLPIATPQFASNWELSGARAAAVGRALMAKGIAKARLTIRGLADQQPRLPNLDEASRRQNRRVEIELRPLG